MAANFCYYFVLTDVYEKWRLVYIAAAESDNITVSSRLDMRIEPDENVLYRLDFTWLIQRPEAWQSAQCFI